MGVCEEHGVRFFWAKRLIYVRFILKIIQPNG